ncbi:GMC family oxidoreductase N-terminal domain-containing protein [SAR86 cluster bacterium]|uniref:GMC family oxidoreductase N-terminal domain-containing protein n=1 Tax=SAR86 cluster bacterium TaxID=2030880 RepID=A0A9Q8X3L9_9GAMM|nr:GMC family oxidoreductase N-terminal domain-containing protein [SAR86 cluster bacterium]
MTKFDYIIVGGGSAGCVLANRLTEDKATNVCLIETGPKDKNPLIHIPAMYAFLRGANLIYEYDTVPQKNFSDVTLAEGPAKISDTFGRTYSVPQSYEEKRKGYQPRGKVLGGSSSVNGMLYVRGHKWDYDHWAELGNEGWSFKDVLPYFKKSENNEVFSDDLHGQGGPLNVAAQRHDNPFTRFFVEAGSKVHKLNNDFNGDDQEGVGIYQVTQKNGLRCSSAVAYLNPIKDRENLTIFTDTTVEKIEFEKLRAKSVKCISKDKYFSLEANKEIILSGGAYGSPTLLMRSGIGDKDFLASRHIECLVDLKGVGENLQDHLDYITTHRVDDWELLGSFFKSLKFTFRAPIEFMKLIFQRNGMFTSPLAEGGAFIKSSKDKEIPDIQLHFVVAMVEDHGRQDLWGNGFSCHMCLLRPESRGTVKIASKDPFEDPLIDPNYLSVQSDIDTMVDGYKRMMEIMNTEPLSNYKNIRNPIDINNDQAIVNALRERSDTIYHPVGTCKMGNDEMAVVDSELRVKGVENLRVVDASIMPTLVGGNTNAPSMMIGEKAADMIRNSK